MGAILVVSPERGDRANWSSIFNTLPEVKILIAESSTKALQLADEYQYRLDLLLTANHIDFSEVGSGPTLLQRLRIHFPLVKAVLIATASVDIHRIGREARFDTVLERPVMLKDLARAIQALSRSI